MEKESTSQSNDWVRCQSKSRPGLFYLFNKKTGETNWCSNDKSPQKTVLSANIVKTPAQDRLKRLQNNLKKKSNGAANDKDKNSRESKKVAEKPKSFQDKKPAPDDKTAPVTKNIVTSPRSVKRKSSDAEKSKQNVTLKKSKTNEEGKGIEPTKPIVKTEERKFVIPKKSPGRSGSNKDGAYKTCKSETQSREATMKRTPTKQIKDSAKSISKSIPLNEFSTVKPVVPLESRPDSGLKTSYVSAKNFNGRKIDQLSEPVAKPAKCSPPINTPIDVTQKSLKSQPNYEAKTLFSGERTKSPMTMEKALQFDINDNEKLIKEEHKPGIVSIFKGFYDKLINKTKSKKKDALNNKDKQSGLSLHSLPSFKSKKTAAVRAIIQENDNKEISNEQIMLSISPPIRTVSSPIPVPIGKANDRLQRLRTSLHMQHSFQNSCPTSPSLSFVPKASSSICSLNDSECEPMDWQPIIDDDFSKSLISTTQISAADTSGQSEHYDTVNENLLRLAATKNQSKAFHWRNDHFYFVVDTNVLINNLTFVKDLLTMKLCDTVGCVVYLPYCVLQELDKLKTRSPSESIKTRSARAIKYLNKSFEEKQELIQAQSAVEETKHLIRVTSPDDSILNCCLQVKKHVENILLLSEDNNLQNKAMASDILVSTKSDLVSKQESSL